MKYKAIALPTPAQGVSFKGTKKNVVPSQAMSLQTILERFTRNEAVPVGRDVAYGDDNDDDLEKVKHMDLVDREEFVNKLKQTQTKYEKQEKAKAAKEHKRIVDETRAKIEAETRSKMAGDGGKSGGPEKGPNGG